MQIKHPQDFGAGLMFIAFGVAAVVIGSNYPIGTAARMGPGYFPRILGILLIVFGIVLVGRGFKLKGERISQIVPKPFVVILGSLLLFALALPRLGLIFSTIMLIVLSSVASHEFRWKESVVSGIILAGFCYLAFSVGLKLQFPIWPVFLGR